jgi:molecular chaperone GrpE (heat shock protein)
MNNFNGNNNIKKLDSNPNNNNNNFNNKFNEPNNDTPNQDTSNENDLKKIKAIIDKCQSYLDESIQLYDAFNIREAITKLCKTINGLDKLKSTINNQKQLYSVLLPQVTSLRNKSFSKLQEYRIMVYKLIPLRFKPVLFRPYDQNESLIDFCGKYILQKTFITFDDIFESNSIEEPKKYRNNLMYLVDQGNKVKNKCFLIYGPHGCGKTLLVHALADKLGARITQIEGVEFFKIPFFSREFIKACFASIKFKPLIIFVKNIEKMFSSINNFNYIYDKVSSSFNLNVYFFASSSINAYNLPRPITDKFQFFQLVKPIDKNSKSEYIRFICKKIGIEIKMNDNDLNNFALENLNSFSNADIFDLIKNAIEFKKKYSPPNDENWVYREGLLKDDIFDALSSIKGSLTPDVLKSYYL